MQVVRPAHLRDPAPYTTQFVTVDKDVRLEVLDWGGSGRPVILLAGGGNTAHVFDEFAPKLAASYHVYGIPAAGSAHRRMLLWKRVPTVWVKTDSLPSGAVLLSCVDVRRNLFALELK